MKRTSAAKKAEELAKYLRNERPDYNYLLALFQNIRKILDVPVTSKSKKLPYVPTEEEIRKFYKSIWENNSNAKMQHIILIKTIIYTGVRVSELIKIKIDDINFNDCQIHIRLGKGKKDRIVPFPIIFRESLALYVASVQKDNAVYLFESSWKKPFSDRGIRKILEKYNLIAGIKHPISPHKLRHFLFTWLKRQGIDDALIQPYSGHESRQSLEVYSKLSLNEAQKAYENVIRNFPV